MAEITNVEIRELLRSIEIIATYPAVATSYDFLLAPVLFAKLMDCRTNGLFQIKTCFEGKDIDCEVMK